MDEQIRKRIQELAARRGGYIEPDDVIADARNPDSPLHGQFEWDVERAAMEHWRNIARKLIASVQIERVINEKTVEVVAYVRDPEKRGNEQGYVDVTILADRKDLARTALVAEFDRAEAALRRALAIAEALDLQEDVELLLRGIGLTRTKATKGAKA
jgi:hypothetical protein